MDDVIRVGYGWNITMCSCPVTSFGIGGEFCYPVVIGLSFS